MKTIYTTDMQPTANELHAAHNVYFCGLQLAWFCQSVQSRHSWI